MMQLLRPFENLNLTQYTKLQMNQSCYQNKLEKLITKYFINYLITKFFFLQLVSAAYANSPFSS